MRFVMISPDRFVDLNKIIEGKRLPATDKLYAEIREAELSVSTTGGMVLLLRGDEARVLWDQITQESQVAEPSPMFEAIRNLVNHAQAACDKLDEGSLKTLPFAMAIDAVRKQFKL